MEDLCRERGVGVVWVEVRCPFDVVKKRLAKNGRDGHILSTEEALKMYRLFQELFEAFPEEAENHVVIDNDGNDDFCSMRDKILKKAA